MAHSRRAFVKTISIATIATTGVLAFLKKFSLLSPKVHTDFTKFVSCAFRLTDHNSLLNLEFYFINCDYHPLRKIIWAKYGPHENYMVVRLPQQHMAEQSFIKTDQAPFKASAMISGYSYLVFRILFPEDNFVKSIFTSKDGNYSCIPLNKEQLLDWNNPELFRLVVRQDLTESLFELKKTNYYLTPSQVPDSIKSDQVDFVLKKNNKTVSAKADSLENHYPFQTGRKDSVLNDTFNINLIPKVYGDPVTAIELPWRLIISPRLPDSSKYRFKWIIPSTEISGNSYKLWTATLCITEKEDKISTGLQTATQTGRYEKNPPSSGLDDIINQLELMILGSPDYPDVDNRYDKILPSGAHRSQLVALYIKLKVLARTDKIQFSAVGATTKIHLKAQDIDEVLKNGIGIIEWNEIISLGRDEKVEISTLVLDAEFGHKMAYIITAERHLKGGYYPLIRKEYLLPLDISKDYSYHITQSDSTTQNSPGTPAEKPVSKFNSPFRKITFLETKPKEMVMLNGVFDPDNVNQTETSFEFEGLDWHDNLVKFSKKINALPFGAVVKKNAAGTPDVAGDISEIVAPKANEMYIPPVVPVIAQADIPFMLAKDLKTAFDKAETNTKIGQIDSLFSQQAKHAKEFSSSLTSWSLKNQLGAQLHSMQSKFDDFVQIYKNKIDNDYSKSEHTIKSIQTTIADELNHTNAQTTIVDSLIRKYFAQGSRFRIIAKQWLEEKSAQLRTRNGFIAYLQDIKKPDLLLEKAGEIPELKVLYTDNLQKLYANVKDAWDKKVDPTLFIDAFINNSEFGKLVDAWKKNYQEWIEDFNKVTAFVKGNNNAYALYDFIRINSPDLMNTMSDIQAIVTKDITDLSDSISARIQTIYQIEEVAKQIPSLILLQKQKIGYAIKDKVEEVDGKIKKSLSELQSEYIIFKGGLREAEDKTFDFFHEYAIIPQLSHAKVYVDTLNKLVDEELPIAIDYPIEYLQNQVEDAVFEIKQNAASVFARVLQSSREQAQGLIQNIGDKMPGLNVEIPIHYLTYAKNQQQVTDATRSLLSKELSEDAVAQLQVNNNDLIFISEEVKNAAAIANDFSKTDPKKYFKDLGAKLFGSISLEDIFDLGFDLPRITRLPDKIIYQVSTDKFKHFEAAFVSFTPNVKDGDPTRLELFISKSLKNIQEYYAFTQLNNFKIAVIIAGTEVLSVGIDKFKISSSPNQAKKTDVTIGEVKLGGPLAFIADLAKKFMAPGNGMRIKPGPVNLLVDYSITLPNITAPAFNFRNLQLVIGVNIPYDPASLKAISFNFGVNKPEDKFVVSAGTYGGRGHFMLRANPRGVEQIDVAIELGAYAFIDLHIGRGEVFMFFGFWFVCGKDDENNNYIKAVAYVICSGSATVLGFITIGVSVLIALTYVKHGQQALFYGEAVVTYSVKIAFFKKEFSIRYYKELAGSSGSSQKNDNTQQANNTAMTLDVSSPFSTQHDTNVEESLDFIDVFKNATALEEYLSCFANS